MKLPTEEELKQWRKEFNKRMMTSAIWEYCPEEFGQLLDMVTELQRQLNEKETTRTGNV